MLLVSYTVKTFFCKRVLLEFSLCIVFSIAKSQTNHGSSQPLFLEVLSRCSRKSYSLFCRCLNCAPVDVIMLLSINTIRVLLVLRPQSHPSFMSLNVVFVPPRGTNSQREQRIAQTVQNCDLTASRVTCFESLCPWRTSMDATGLISCSCRST